MIVKVIYRKNLKMSEGKLASQVAHAVIGLGVKEECIIRVLKVSDKKFDELTNQEQCYIQRDWGLTEIDKDTPTCAAWYE